MTSPIISSFPIFPEKKFRGLSHTTAIQTKNGVACVGGKYYYSEKNYLGPEDYGTSKCPVEIFHLSEGKCKTEQYYDCLGHAPLLKGHSAAAMDNQITIFIFGGELYENDPQSKSKELYQYEIHNMVIKCNRVKCAKSPPERAWHKSVSIHLSNANVNDNENQEIEGLWIGGGIGNQNEFLSDSWTWDPNSGWQLIESTGENPFPLAHYSCSKLEKNKLAIFGGYDGQKMNNNLYLYDSIELSWSQVELQENLAPLPRCWHESVIISAPRNEPSDNEDNIFEPKLLIYGGYQQNGNSCDKSIELIDINSGNVESLNLSPSINLPSIGHSLIMSSKNRIVYIFGGINSECNPVSTISEIKLSVQKETKEDESLNDSNDNPVKKDKTDVKRNISYENGDYYEGEVENDDIRSGKGMLKYKNGNVFNGNFTKNLRDGHGTLNFFNPCLDDKKKKIFPNTN